MNNVRCFIIQLFYLSLLYMKNKTVIGTFTIYDYTYLFIYLFNLYNIMRRYYNYTYVF